MQIVSAVVGPFKSINSPQKVEIESDVTVLVGMNEAGKMVFLQALQKADDAQDLAGFDPVHDYPRKAFTPYMKRHVKKPETVVVLEYKPTVSELAEINDDLATELRWFYVHGCTRLRQQDSRRQLPC